MLRPGDVVLITGTGEHGYVTRVHTHEVLVHVTIAGEREERRYTHESPQFVPANRTPSPLYAR